MLPSTKWTKPLRSDSNLALPPIPPNYYGESFFDPAPNTAEEREHASRIAFVCFVMAFVVIIGLIMMIGADDPAPKPMHSGARTMIGMADTANRA